MNTPSRRQTMKRSQNRNSVVKTTAYMLWLTSLCLTLVLAGCSDSGSSSPNYKLPDDQAIGATTGLVFSYPFAGQQDVALATQIVARFADGSASAKDFKLIKHAANADSVK